MRLTVFEEHRQRIKMNKDQNFNERTRFKKNTIAKQKSDLKNFNIQQSKYIRIMKNVTYNFVKLKQRTFTPNILKKYNCTSIVRENCRQAKFSF